ncbi:beta/gamma crystallin domain-containing protein 1-like [Etheostoma cragini]|uniref:beta/gamma crystallin domain-containing protein 1-like n=1 Tax=Etheostoma cragini TaxID=417921 RepID=UPI00155EAFBC|nr:beta/gamma crystallin domain-containing protein 1-like [Etheostoma cragini]
MTNSGMNMRGKIIFYEERNFQGRHYECMSDCSDMTSYLSRCHSCRVESGCFMVYDRPNYMGNQYFMRRGEYADYMSMMGMRDSIRSCRMIPMYRGQFRMKIYERENFVGQHYEMMDDCDNIMDRYRMNDCQSCHVMDGHWLMYEQPHYRGRMMYMRPGEYRSFRDMGMSGMRWMSMRRITDSCWALILNVWLCLVVYKRKGLNQVGRPFRSNSTSTADMTNTNMNMRGKIIFYEERNFQGRHYECMSDCADMSSYLSRCHSCRVESGCFMVYDRTNYMGNQYFMKRGEYADYMSMMGMRDCVRSFRMIPMHRGQYRMRIYERENFGGQMYELMDDCDNMMDRYRMNDCQSCHVMDGHWMMYEQPHYRGRMMYMRPGEYRSFRDMGMSGMRWMSMRRITDSYY